MERQLESLISLDASRRQSEGRISLESIPLNGILVRRPATPVEEPPVAKKNTQRMVLRYPQHLFKPEDLLNFVELPQFTRRWDSLDLDDEQDLSALQACIMAAPKSGVVVKGTRSLRKLRFAPATWNTGKSGAVRVLYVYFEEYHVVLLCVVYDKTEEAEISQEAKRLINRAIVDVENELERLYQVKVKSKRPHK
jgi:hypothetical protein